MFKSAKQKLTAVTMRDVMVRAPASVRHSEPLRVAANRLEQSSADAVVVRFDEGTTAGLLTERDIVLGAQSEAEDSPDTRAGTRANASSSLTKRRVSMRFSTDSRPRTLDAPSSSTGRVDRSDCFRCTSGSLVRASRKTAAIRIASNRSAHVRAAESDASHRHPIELCPWPISPGSN